MSRGAYRHLALLEAQDYPPTPDGTGGFVETWTPLDPPQWWCSIDSATIRNSERVMENTITVSASHLLRGDYHPQLLAGCRITLADPETPQGQRRFDVVSVQREGERRFTLLVGCNESQNPADPREAA